MLPYSDAFVPLRQFRWFDFVRFLCKFYFTFFCFCYSGSFFICDVKVFLKALLKFTSSLVYDFICNILKELFIVKSFGTSLSFFVFLWAIYWGNFSVWCPCSKSWNWPGSGDILIPSSFMTLWYKGYQYLFLFRLVPFM